MVSNQRLSALLGSLLGHWEYTVPEVQLRRGLVYTGSNHRLRAVVQKAMSGQPVKIGVIGELGKSGGERGGWCIQAQSTGSGLWCRRRCLGNLSRLV